MADDLLVEESLEDLTDPPAPAAKSRWGGFLASLHDEDDYDLVVPSNAIPSSTSDEDQRSITNTDPSPSRSPQETPPLLATPRAAAVDDLPLALTKIASEGDDETTASSGAAAMLPHVSHRHRDLSDLSDVPTPRDLTTGRSARVMTRSATWSSPPNSRGSSRGSAAAASRGPGSWMPSPRSSASASSASVAAPLPPPPPQIDLPTADARWGGFAASLQDGDDALPPPSRPLSAASSEDRRGASRPPSGQAAALSAAPLPHPPPPPPPAARAYQEEDFEDVDYDDDDDDDDDDDGEEDLNDVDDDDDDETEDDASDQHEGRMGSHKVEDSRVHHRHDPPHPSSPSSPPLPDPPQQREPLLRLRSLGEAPLDPYTPPPRGVMVQCVVRRVWRGGGVRGLSPPTYMLSAQLLEPSTGRMLGEQFLLAARRRRARNPIKARGPSYLISRSPETIQAKGGGCVGKLKSNFLGTEWTLVDGAKAKPNAQTAMIERRSERAMALADKASRRRIDPSSYPSAMAGALKGGGGTTTAAEAAEPLEAATADANPAEHEQENRQQQKAAAAAAADPAAALPITGATALERLSRSMRRELAHISSAQNVIGECAPRKVRIVLPWSPAATRAHEGGEASPALGNASAGTLPTVAKGEVAAPPPPLDQTASPSAFAPRGVPRTHQPLSSERGLGEMVRERSRVLDRVHHAAEYGGPGAEALGGLLVLSSREAALNKETGKRSLNFGGRVTMGSVKNQQLELGAPHATPGPIVGPDGTRPIVFQFGKRGKDTFILDFRHPLSPIQAFAIGITALARKLASEGG